MINNIRTLKTNQQINIYKVRVVIIYLIASWVKGYDQKHSKNNKLLTMLKIALKNCNFWLVWEGVYYFISYLIFLW